MALSAASKIIADCSRLLFALFVNDCDFHLVLLVSCIKWLKRASHPTSLIFPSYFIYSDLFVFAFFALCNHGSYTKIPCSYSPILLIYYHCSD
jgi:hypothetical protein